MVGSAAQNLKITGNGSALGGLYDMVKITGNGKISGNVECSLLKCSGEAEIHGKVTAKDVKIMGNSVFTGGLSAGKAKLMGQNDITGDMAVNDLSCDGVATVNGHVTGEELRLRGRLHVKGNCETEKFFFKGLMDIGGLLNAGVIDIKLHGGESKAKEIGGELIKVNRWRILGLFKWFGPSFPSFLTAEHIEGDDIYLEYTKANIVRGNRITLGPGCEIGLVEYKETFQTNKSSIVSKQNKV